MARRMPAILLALVLLLTGLALPAGAEETARIEPWGTPEEAARLARDIMLQAWRSNYADDGIGDGYLEIRSMRVFAIREHPEAFRSDGQPVEGLTMFDDMAYVVEFSLLTDYMGTAPYYFDYRINDHLVLYRDGSAKIQLNPFRSFTSRYYINDYTGIIASVTDLGTALNGVWDLK